MHPDFFREQLWQVPFVPGIFTGERDENRFVLFTADLDGKRSAGAELR
jgi:hypothetical protein